MKWFVWVLMISYLIYTYIMLKRLVLSFTRRLVVKGAGWMVAAFLIGWYVDSLAQYQQEISSRSILLDLVMAYFMSYQFDNTRKMITDKDYPHYDNLTPMLDICLYGLVIAVLFYWFGHFIVDIYSLIVN